MDVIKSFAAPRKLEKIKEKNLKFQFTHALTIYNRCFFFIDKL